MTNSLFDQINAESSLPPNKAASFLLIEYGHTHTTAVLFDVVGESYRLIAKATTSSTHHPPHHHTAVGVRRAIRQIEQITHRTFLDNEGQLITPQKNGREGVDYFGVTTSVIEPLRTIVAGLLDEVSLLSARRVLQQNYVQQVEQFSLKDDRPLQTQVNAIRALRPDLIFIVGGTDGGATDQVLSLVEAAVIGVQQFPLSERAQIIYAGNAALRERVTQTVGGATNLHVAANVRPILGAENLAESQQILTELVAATKLNRAPGLADVLKWGNIAPQPVSQAVRVMVEFLATLMQGRVLCVDVGSDTVVLATAVPEKPDLLVKPSWGVGEPLPKLLANEQGSHAIQQWMPELLADQKLREMVYNEALFPHTVPMTRRDLYLLNGVVHQLLAETWATARENWEWLASGEAGPAVQLLILRGSTLCGMPRTSQAVLMVLNTLQPTGIFAVAMDNHHVLATVGVLAHTHPVAAVQAVEQGILTDLGWVVVVDGHGREGTGQLALNITLTSPRLGVLDFEISWGSLTVIPMPLGEEIELLLQPARGFNVGAGKGKKRELRIHGGGVGLMVDARGRPLQLPDDLTARQQQMRQWLWDVGG